MNDPYRTTLPVVPEKNYSFWDKIILYFTHTNCALCENYFKKSELKVLNGWWSWTSYSKLFDSIRVQFKYDISKILVCSDCYNKISSEGKSLEKKHKFETSVKEAMFYKRTQEEAEKRLKQKREKDKLDLILDKFYNEVK